MLQSFLLPSLSERVVKLWFVYMHVSAAIFMAFSAATASDLASDP